MCCMATAHIGRKLQDFTSSVAAGAKIEVLEAPAHFPQIVDVCFALSAQAGIHLASDLGYLHLGIS